MAATSLLALIDDIATLLDDVGTLTKVATNKTAGVLGDDLALNAEQVTGVRPERELPVVWAVAKGSAWNKLIIVPTALAMSEFLPWAITPILMLGGAFLCFEGFEKVAHKFLHAPDEDRAARLARLSDESLDPVELEKKKIKGAIRTDFILSAEIVVIALGSLQEASFLLRALTMASVATVVTVGVYVLVAAIVKMDDAGLSLSRAADGNSPSNLEAFVGRSLLWMAPRLLRTLSVLGTIAMFLVGGGILIHGIPFLDHLVHGARASVSTLPSVGMLVGALIPTLITFVVGLVAGGLLVGMVSLAQKLRPRRST